MLETDPDKIMSDSMQAEIDRLTQSGELRIRETLGDPQIPATPQRWTVPAFLSHIQSNRATIPQFAGAIPPGAQNVLDLAKSTITDSEGFYPTAYYGSKNPNRTDAKNITVRPGTFDDNAPASAANEVSIGYGYNLNAHKEWRTQFKQMFGFSDADVQAIADGRKGLTRDQADQLRDRTIFQFNAQLDRMLPGVTLTDGQRAALISLAYNAGTGNLRKSGIPDAIQHGAPPDVVAGMIRSFNTLGGQLQNRRNHEAAVYLGAQSQAYFDNNSNKLPPIAAADMNPRDRH